MAAAMSPRAEDFERLAVRWADAIHSDDGYPSMVAAIAAFPEHYLADRDALPQNDSDRAFWLVCRASEILDRGIYEVADDAAAMEMAQQATALLDEALVLDPNCHDAKRMRYALDRPSRDDMVSWLSDNADDVRESCLKAAAAAELVPPDGHWGLSVYLRPYLRWLLSLANEQLNCGRYRCSLEVCDKLLELDANDVAGARMVAAYDYVKLEDAEGLAGLIGRFPGEKNAWFLLARCFMAYKQRRLDDAAAILHEIVRTYPSAGYTLALQEELPSGLFSCHLEFAPMSADELYIAMSEASVVTDENCGDYVSALAGWIAADEKVVEAYDREALSGGAAAAAGPASGGADEEGAVR